MNSWRKFLGGIVGMLLGVGLAAGQQPSGPTYNLPNSPTPVPSSLQEDSESTSLPKVISNWVSYRDKTPPNTEPNAPCSSPIGADMFLRSGTSTPFGSGVFPAVLNTGWVIEGGVRGLFYDDNKDAAWVISASVSNIYNSAHFNTDTVPINHVVSPGNPGLAVVDATVRDLNRTFVNVGLGHDWYLWMPKPGQRRCEGFLSNVTSTWGVDAGVRYGSGRVQYVEIMHTTGVLVGGYAALHGEFQIPLGCSCLFEIGWRAEWGYTHSNVLVQSSNGFYDADVLLNMGVRY